MEHMITVHVPETKQRQGQTFLYQVEKIFCKPECVITEMAILSAVTAAGPRGE